MNKLAATVTLSLLAAAPSLAQKPPLLPEPVVAALAHELSGESAKRNLEFLARLHRQRGSRQFHQAARHIESQLKAYGLEQVEILKFPADGKTMYGTQKARLAWDADFAELWELREVNGQWVRSLRLASFEAMPITLAQDSESGQATADLVDVGAGTSESDYEGKDVRGKLVLTSSQPGPVATLAVDRYGAAGIISYAQNQRTAWWKENENLIRWGHLGSFREKPAFAFMVSLKQARSFQERLARGEQVRLEAKVEAGRHEGFLDVVTAVIPGAELPEEEIAFSCHLDHQKPGANDNASGCVTILEVARTFAKLIREGRLERPRRTLRFIWPPEIEGTVALLNARPEFAKRIKAVIHMDMVGGDPETKAIFHVTRSPMSLPSFINDVAEAFGEFVNGQSDRYASGETVPYPLVSPEGGKEALQAKMAEFSSGSDHQVYTEGSFRIPAIYLNDWPDRYIHTNFDTPDKIDPTKLKRAGFIGAASAYFLANMNSGDVEAVWKVLQRHALGRLAVMLERREGLAGYEASNQTRFMLNHEKKLQESMARFAQIAPGIKKDRNKFIESLREIAGLPGRPEIPADLNLSSGLVYVRNPEIKGPLSVFGYNYFTDRYGREKTSEIRLLRYRGLRGSGGAYAYEVLNFVDGKRTVREIRDAVSAEYGPIPFDLVAEYLEALKRIGIVAVAAKLPPLPDILCDPVPCKTNQMR